ncbi:MAG: hypothetical protein ACR2IF_13690 [Terriglobales bacterium]
MISTPKARRAGRPQRQIDIDRIRELREKGWNKQAIAKELGIGMCSLNRALRAVGESRATIKYSEKCALCSDPRVEEITQALLERGVPAAQKEFGLRRGHLMRHYKHLGFDVRHPAQKDAPDINKCRGLFNLMRRTAIKAHDKDDFRSAAQAGGVAFRCMELLLTRSPNAKGGANADTKAGADTGSRPTSAEELDREIANHVREATKNFDPTEIERLRRIVDVPPGRADDSTSNHHNDQVIVAPAPSTDLIDE